MHIHDIYGRFFCNVLPLVLYCGKLLPGKNLPKLVIIHYLSLLCAHTVVVDTQEMVTGYTDDGVVVLTCEVYGYLRSTVRWWRETGGARQLLQTTPKYTIQCSSGSCSAHTTQQNIIIANLTIHQLARADAGTYVCETGGVEERAAQLIVMPDSRPTEETLGTGETEITTTMLGGSTG